MKANPVLFAKAIADETRQKIMSECCCCWLSVNEIVEKIGLSQPTISHHLKVLREAGLVTVSRRGVWAYYAPSPRGLAVLRQALAALEPTGLVVAG